MLEKYIPHIQTPEEKRVVHLEALFGFLGVRESPEDQEQIKNSVSILREEIEKTPKVGRTIEQNKAGRNEFVIPLISSDQKERLIENLSNLGIFPWEQDGLLIIDRKHDLEKLQLAGIVKGTYYQEKREAEVTVGADVEGKMYQFPLPQSQSHPVEKRPHAGRKFALEKKEKEDPESGIDTELVKIIQKFDAGILDDEDKEFTKKFGVMPTLTLFPRKYIWKKGVLIHARTGEIITLEKQKSILESAQSGDAKAREDYIRMHTGFVLYLAKSIQKRFGGDMDELFQEGLLGLDRAIETAESERETKFTTYAAYWIEQRMRRFLMDNRIDVRLPINKYSERSKIRKLRNTEEKKKQLLGGKYDIPENLEYAQNIDRLARRLFIDVKFDPIEENFSEENWHDIDQMGNDLFERNTQEKKIISQEFNDALYEVLQTLSPRERFVLAAHNGLAVAFMLPEEIKPFLSKKGITFDKAGNVKNPEDLKVIDWYALYISHQAYQFPNLQTTSDFTEGFTLEQIGDFMGFHGPERARQIEMKAIRRLRHPSLSRLIRGFLNDEIFPNPEERINFIGDKQKNERINLLREKIPTDKLEPPQDWLTLGEMGDKFKMNTGIIWDIFNKLRKYNQIESPHNFTIASLGRTKQFFSPETAQSIEEYIVKTKGLSEKEIEEFDLEQQGWKKSEIVAKELGLEVVDLMLKALNYRSGSPYWFKDEYLHPNLIKILREKLSEK